MEKLETHKRLCLLGVTCICSVGGIKVSWWPSDSFILKAMVLLNICPHWESQSPEWPQAATDLHIILPLPHSGQVQFPSDGRMSTLVFIGSNKITSRFRAFYLKAI